MRRTDMGLVLAWLRAPHVRRWWPSDDEPTAADVEAEYGPYLDGSEPSEAWIILADGAPVGLVKRYRHADYPDWEDDVGVPHAAGIDYLVGEGAVLGRGVGSASVALFARLTLNRYPEVDAVVAAPQADNRASCRTLERAGFVLVDRRDLTSDEPSEIGRTAIYRLARPARLAPAPCVQPMRERLTGTC